MNEQMNKWKPKWLWYCFWLECESYNNTIQENAPQTHVRYSRPIYIQTNKYPANSLSCNKFTIFHSINNYLFSNQTSVELPIFIYIHLYHFPISLLEQQTNNSNINITTPLSYTITTRMNKDDTMNCLTTYTNSAFYLHNNKLKSIDPFIWGLNHRTTTYEIQD